MANVAPPKLDEYRLLRSIAVQYEGLTLLHKSLNEMLLADQSKRVAEQYRERMRNLRDE